MTAVTFINVLVAEDIDSNYMLINAILKKSYNIFRATNGLEAVELVKAINPDLVLMDIRMPLMDGLEATSRIREFNKTLPIVALTAHAFDSDRDIALSVGCDDYLTKPVDKDVLRLTVAHYTGKDN